MRVEGERLVSLDMGQDQPLQTLGDDGCECNWAVVLVANSSFFFFLLLFVLLCNRMIMADFRQDGVDYIRDRLDNVVKTCESCATQALSTFPGPPMGLYAQNPFHFLRLYGQWLVAGN